MKTLTYWDKYVTQINDRETNVVKMVGQRPQCWPTIRAILGYEHALEHDKSMIQIYKKHFQKLNESGHAWKDMLSNT